MMDKVHSPRIEENGVLLPPFDLAIPNCSYPEFVWEGIKGQVMTEHRHFFPRLEHTSCLSDSLCK